jgi:Mg2+/Co2+ transporter CorC
VSPWALITIATVGGVCGVVIANIVIAIRHLGDMEDIWDDEEDD